VLCTEQVERLVGVPLGPGILMVVIPGGPILSRVEGSKHWHVSEEAPKR
jgi:hypothetical protein